MSENTIDYKESLRLPKTDFPMRAGLSKKEPELLKRWDTQNLWQKTMEQSKGKPPFVLHDGPPYANGHLHIGHALNKILKDIINRSQLKLGKKVHYIPGWDCHGLPIEWKIEEKYRKQGKDKDDIDIVEFRQECRQFAASWLDTQRQEFKRLGVQADWDHPYNTMNYESEATIANELGKFLLNGSLYRGVRPVLWSVVEKTALAEAEVEYDNNHKSPAIWVKFPVKSSPNPDLKQASIVIWTTTPWTIPSNRAITYHTDISYGRYLVADTQEDSLAIKGEVLLLADSLAQGIAKSAKINRLERLGDVGKLDGTVCAHPLAGQGYDFDVPVLFADYVSSDTGTGFVHTAPSHGVDDFNIGRQHNLEIPENIAEDGHFYDHVPLFAGAYIYKEDGKPGDANGLVIKTLIQAHALLAKSSLRHSYPISWRSHTPLIYRTTAQWFISIDKKGLRTKALEELKKVEFYPPQSRNRLTSMIEGRPDWCISRQRAWGVPLPIFLNKQTNEPLLDPEVLERIVSIFTKEGADSWFIRPVSDFLGPHYNPEDYEQIRDVVDVWFDSGSTHAFVMEKRSEINPPADLYLEGTDQHRGWFQSSLLESIGTRGKSPYKALFTNGFVMDEKGRKMAKSLGDSLAPEVIAKQYGIEILRLWAVSSNYFEDLRVGPDILKKNMDSYRRLRNTLRWLLGNLSHYDLETPVDYNDLPELEKWVCHRLFDTQTIITDALKNYDLHRIFRTLHDFCTIDLSAFYFDIRKDALYCDAASSLRRRAALTVLDLVFKALTSWLSPILCFTAEEAWLVHKGTGDNVSIHLEPYVSICEDYKNEDIHHRWETIRKVRRTVLGALEIERSEKRLGSSLQAIATVYTSQEINVLLQGLDLNTIFITSGVKLSTQTPPENAYRLNDVPNVGVIIELSPDGKCDRCWQYLESVGKTAEHPHLCHRCIDAITMLEA